jgi:ATP-binding cassette, subfamily C, bacterial CydD
VAGVDRRLLRESRSARLPLAVAVVLGVASAVLLIAQAALFARVIAGAVDGDSLGDLRGALIALAAVVAARALVAGAFELSGRRAAGRVMRELRARLGDHILHVRPTALDGRPSGELVTAAVQGVDALETYFARYLPQTVLAVCVPVLLVAWILPRDLAAGIVLLVTVPLVPVFMVLIGLAARTRSERRWHALTRLGAHFVDVVHGLETLRAHDRDRAQAETLAAAGDAYRRETMGTLRVAFLSALVLELFAMLGTALVAATVGVQLADGHLGLETGLAVLILAPELYQPIRQLGAQFHAATDGLAAAEQILAVIDEPPAVRAPAAPRAMPDPTAAAVELVSVSVSYPGRGGPVLDRVSLRLEPGARVALVGPSGAGKSTLAALLLRLLEPDEGAVRCGGVDLRDVDPAEWRRLAAWMPQRPTIFAGSVADNIRLGAPDAAADEVGAAIAAAGLEPVVSSLPDGLETRIGEGGRRLSAGERQRVALARAFLKDAPLLVLDEPTAHLDAETARSVASGIERLSAGRTTLLVVHHPALAAGADEILELGDGRLGRQSTVAEAAA